MVDERMNRKQEDLVVDLIWVLLAVALIGVIVWIVVEVV